MSEKMTMGDRIASTWFNPQVPKGSHKRLTAEIDAAIAKACAEERKRAEGLREALVLVDHYLTDDSSISYYARHKVKQAIATYDQSIAKISPHGVITTSPHGHGINVDPVEFKTDQSGEVEGASNER